MVARSLDALLAELVADDLVTAFVAFLRRRLKEGEE